MDTAIINIRVEPQIKTKVQQIAEALGFSVSSLVNAFLKELIRTKTISFTLMDEEPNQHMIKALKESEEDRRMGRYYSFDKRKEAISFLDKLINARN